MSITNQWHSLLLNSHARKHCYSDKQARNEKRRFFVGFFPRFVGGKTVKNEVIIVHKLVSFMINFSGFVTKQEQPGCRHAIVVSNRQSGWPEVEVVGKTICVVHLQPKLCARSQTAPVCAFSRLFSSKSASRLESNAERPCWSNLLKCFRKWWSCMWLYFDFRRKWDHVWEDFLCRYVQNYLLLPVIYNETRKIQFFLNSESIRDKERDLLEPFGLCGRLSSTPIPRSLCTQNRLTFRVLVGEDVNWSP